MYAGLAKGLQRTRGRMNATETKYAASLDILRHAGEIIDYAFERQSFRLTLPDNDRPIIYTPDFGVLHSDYSISYEDVKGGAITDAALLRIKVAASEFWWFKWRIVQNVRRDEWKFREISG